MNRRNYPNIDETAMSGAAPSKKRRICKDNNHEEVVANDSLSIMILGLRPPASTTSTADRFKNVMGQLKSKQRKPLMTRSELKTAKGMEFDADQFITPVMRTAVTLFDAPSNKFNPDIQMIAKAGCLTARFNDISETTMGLIVPEEHPPLSLSWDEKKKLIQAYADLSRKDSLAWLVEAVEQIKNNINGSPWGKIFHQFNEIQRKEIYGAVFNQYPIWLMSKFRSIEAKIVNFQQIFQSVDSPDRLKYRQFFRHMFIDLSEAAYQIQIKTGVKGETPYLIAAWKEFPRKSDHRALGLGGAETLPM